MRKIIFALLCWFLLYPVYSAKGQFVSRGRNGLSDSAIHAEEDSLENAEIYTRHHRATGFLENDFAFGGTVGTPGGLNVIAEKYISLFGLRAEAGAFGLIPLSLIAGYQFDLSVVLTRSETALFECTAFYSNYYSSSIDDNIGAWTHSFGLGLAVDAKGFFFQIGFTPAYFKTLQPNFNSFFPSIFQIGYVD